MIEFPALLIQLNQQRETESLINVVRYKLKLQAAMNGVLTPPGGLKKTVNGGQYVFKWVNIGGLCQSKLCVPQFLLPAGGAMSITDY